MGIFSRKSQEKTLLENFLDQLNPKLYGLNNNTDISDVKSYLKKIINKEERNPFYTDENLIIVLDQALQIKEGISSFEDYIYSLEDLFISVYTEGRNSDFTYFETFVSYFNNYELYNLEETKEGNFSIDFYNLFDNKKCFYVLMDKMQENDDLEFEKHEVIINFLISIRSKFLSEEEFFYSALAFLKKITYGIEIEKLIKEEETLINKKAGIYDISESTLDMIHEQVTSSEGFLKRLEETVKQADTLKGSLQKKIEGYRTELETINIESEKKYRESLAKDLQELNDLLESCKKDLTSFKSNILEDVTKSISETRIEAEKALKEYGEKLLKTLKEYEALIGNVALNKSSELSKLGDTQVSKLEQFVINQPHLKELIESIGPNQETIKVVSDLIAQASEINNIAASASTASGTNPASAPVFGAPGIITPTPIIVDYTINPYFDKSRSFTSRINELKEKMQKNHEEKGILYHSETINILTALLEELNPYLYGPSGGGKTMAVKLICELLELPYINVGYINEEYQVVGAEPFMGYFKRSGIHESFQEGKIAFIDEFDNGNAKASIALNPFLRRSEDYYTFANMERVKRHPNFRVIAAGNTDGKGGTRNHSTREAIEASVLQRLTLFFIGYDEEVEKSLLSKHPDWYNFILAFRRAQASWSGNEGEMTLEDAVTTSDIAKIEGILKDKAFTVEQIIASDFIQAKSRDYLEAIRRYLRDYYSSEGTRKEKDIYNTFEEEVKKYYLKRGLE